MQEVSQKPGNTSVVFLERIYVVPLPPDFSGGLVVGQANFILAEKLRFLGNHRLLGIKPVHQVGTDFIESVFFKVMPVA